MRKKANLILKKFGYEIKKINKNEKNLLNNEEIDKLIDPLNGYELYRYLNNDNSFNYEEYKNIQISANKRKINAVWVKEEHIEFLSNYIKKLNLNPKFGICHGTRRGKEQEWFRKYLDCEVIGTEISDTAKDFPNTIQWDFHEIKPEWINNIDFIYSNSFDHSYEPEKCLDNWMTCINPKGICIIEHTLGHVKAKKLDPFGARIDKMPYLITQWGKGKYSVREMLDVEGRDGAKFFIIQKNSVF